MDGMSMLQKMSAGVTALVLICSISACSGKGRSDADVKKSVVSQLEERGLDAKAASCVAGVLINVVGVDTVKKIDLSASTPDNALAKGIAAAAIKARATCQVDINQLQG